MDLNRLAQEPAVHPDVRAGDKSAGLGAGEENRRADEFARFAEAPQRRMGPNGPGAGGRRAIVVE